MSDAKTLFSEIKKEMADLEARIRNHPFIAAVEAGEAPREALTIFAGEQYHIIESDLRSVAQLLSRHPAPLTHAFFWGALQGEKAALNNIVVLGRALGLDREALSAREPAPEAHAYPAYMAWLGVYGSAGQTPAAFALNFDAWGANCGRMGAGLREHYGLSAGDLAFFESFANPPTDLAERAAEIVDQDLARGIPPNGSNSPRGSCKAMSSCSGTTWKGADDLNSPSDPFGLVEMGELENPHEVFPPGPFSFPFLTRAHGGNTES